MSCAHGCQDGWIYVGDACRACECQRHRRGEFSGDYSPGGKNQRAARRSIARRNGRRGGLASGVKRRQLAKGKRIPRSREQAQALALRYPHRQLSRSRFYATYKHAFPCTTDWGAGVSSWERGRETCWLLYSQVFTRYRVQGQHFRTSKPQRALALKNAGRARADKTVQRHFRRLEAMGLLKALHYKRGGARAGMRDHLVVEIRTAPKIGCPTAPSGQSEPSPVREVLTAAPEKVTENRGAEPSTASVAPPSAADTAPPDKPAERPDTERAELERHRDFLQLKLASGWDSPRIRADLIAVERQLSGHDRARIVSVSSEGFRCST